MNNTDYYDSSVSDEQRRQMLFDGQLFGYSPRKSTLAFIAFARELIEEAFASPQSRDGAVQTVRRPLC